MGRNDDRHIIPLIISGFDRLHVNCCNYLSSIVPFGVRCKGCAELTCIKDSVELSPLDAITWAEKHGIDVDCGSASCVRIVNSHDKVFILVYQNEEIVSIYTNGVKASFADRCLRIELSETSDTVIRDLECLGETLAGSNANTSFSWSFVSVTSQPVTPSREEPIIEILDTWN